MFELKKTEGGARRGEFTCAHGTVQTPVFMNVGTQGAIKGALSAEDLRTLVVRWSFPIPITCICALPIKLSGKWAAFISL